MAKLRSTIKIPCFSYNRFVKKHIETEMIEKIESRTSTSRKFIIVDNAVELVSIPIYNEDMEVVGNSDYWRKVAEIRRKEFIVDTVSVWFRETLKRLYFQQNGGNTTLSALTEPLINKTRLVSLKASNLKVFEDSVKKVDQAHIVSDIDVNYTFRFMRVINGYVNYKMFFIGGGLTEIESLEFSSLWNDYLNTI